MFVERTVERSSRIVVANTAILYTYAIEDVDKDVELVFLLFFEILNLRTLKFDHIAASYSRLDQTKKLL